MISKGWNDLKGLLPENYLNNEIENINNKLKLFGIFLGIALICFAISNNVFQGASKYEAEIYVERQGWVRSRPNGKRIGYSIAGETYKTSMKKGDWYYAKGRYE